MIELAEGALGDLGAGGEALGLVVVGDVILGGGGDAVVLQAAYEGGGKVGGEDGALAERLEVAAPERARVRR